jgi:hypothetical protein
MEDCLWNRRLKIQIDGRDWSDLFLVYSAKGLERMEGKEKGLKVVINDLREVAKEREPLVRLEVNEIRE